MLSPYPKMSYAMQNVAVPEAYSSSICVLGQSNTLQGFFSGLETKTIDDINALFGENEEITRKLRVALQELAKQTTVPKVYAYSVIDPSAGTAAVATITITAATQPTQTLTGYFATSSDANSGFFSLDILSSDTADNIATKLGASLNGLTHLGITVSVATNVVTITAGNLGATGNDLFENIIINEGVGVSFALSVTAGAGQPDFSGLFSLSEFLGTKIDYFVTSKSYTNANNTLKTALFTRSENLVNNKDLSGNMIYGISFDPASIPALTIDTAGKNIVVVGNKKLTSSTALASNFIFTLNDELSTLIAIQEAIKLTIDCNTVPYLINQTSGKPANCAIPVANTRLSSIRTFFPLQSYTSPQITNCENNRYTIITILDNGTPIIGNAFTLSNEPQYSGYENRQQFFFCRYYFSTRLQTFVQQKTWVNGEVVNINQINADSYSAECELRYNVLTGLEVATSDFDYWAGIVDSGIANFNVFREVLNKTLKFTVVVTGGRPVGTISHSLFLTASMQIKNLVITQQNNLISA